MKEGGISARKAVQMWGLSMKKSALQVGRVTFDPRKGPSRPSPIFGGGTKNENGSQIS